MLPVVAALFAVFYLFMAFWTMSHLQADVRQRGREKEPEMRYDEEAVAGFIVVLAGLFWPATLAWVIHTHGRL